MSKEYTKPLVFGYGPDGITGPMTASVTGPTCGGKEWKYKIVTRGQRTVGIFPDQGKVNAPDHDAALRNARLFAASEDLLDSLCTVLALAKVKYGNLHDDVNEVFAKADAAIAKARGE